MKLILPFLVGLALMVSATFLQADDWKTTDGKIYQKVTVVKVEPDAVTILHQNGGALVPLTTLSPELQKQFKYDPATAQAAAEARTKAQAESAKALQAEMNRAEQQRQAALIAQNPNPPTDTPTASSLGETQMSFSTPADPKHYGMGTLVDTSIKLRWDHPYGDDHYSMGALFSPTQRLTPDPDANHHTTNDLFGGSH